MKKFLLWSLTLLLGVTLSGCFESESNTAAADAVIRSLNQAHKTDSTNKLKQIGIACSMFADDNSGRLPDGLSALAESNSSIKSVLIASYDKKSTASGGSAIKSGNTSYAYLGRGLTLKNNAGFPLCIEKPWLLPSEENTVRALFANGEVKQFSIPGVSGKSCQDVVSILLKDCGDTPEAEKLLQNARRIDKNHKK